MDGAYVLIDSPVGPFSHIAEIEAWINELKEMPKNPQVDEAIAVANEWLENHGY